MPASRKIKIVFLGTNGWYDTATGNTISLLIETPDEYIVLEAGNGLYKLDRYVSVNKPIYLFLSHFHLDHVVGLHVLAKFRFPQGLHICLGRGMKKVLQTLVSSHYTVPLPKLPYRVWLHQFSAQSSPFPFLRESRLLRHPVPCWGWRFCLEGRIITYLADTGLCDNAYQLARGADLLISECAFKVGQPVTQWPHLNPQQAAQLAAQVGVKRLVLVHFDASLYRTFRERKKAVALARSFFRNVSAARDGQFIVL